MTETSKEAAPAKTSEIDRIKAQLEDVMTDFLNECQRKGFATNKDHKYLTGGGYNNYLLIHKAFEIAFKNPNLMPRHLDVSLLDGKLLEMKELENFMDIMRDFAVTADIATRYKIDECYHDAHTIYGSLEECTKARVMDTQPLLYQLQPFIHHAKKRPSE
jgi:hypothetical protein